METPEIQDVEDSGEVPRIEPRMDKIIAALAKKAAMLKAKITQAQKELSACEAAIEVLDNGNRQQNRGLSGKVREIVLKFGDKEFTIHEINAFVEPETRTQSYTSVVASALKRMQTKGQIEFVGKKPGKGQGKLNIYRLKK